MLLNRVSVFDPLRTLAATLIVEIQNWATFEWMKSLAAFILISATAQAAPPRSVETVLIPTGPREPDYRLVIEGSSDASDQDDDTRRLIIIAGKQRTTISVEGGLAAIRNPANGLHSKFVFRSRTMPNNMVIVFGHQFDTGPAEMRIIRLGAVPQQVLAEEEFHLTDIRRGTDGRSLLIIGKHTSSEMIGKCISTYDPYAVFKINDAAKDRFRYSLALSKQYNLAHYGGWAGPKYRKDVGVNICRKPARIARL